MTDAALSAAAKLLSSRGARKGGLARAAELTTEERTAIARRAAQTRWHNVRTPPLTMEGQEIGEVWIEVYDNLLRLTIGERKDTTTLSLEGVDAVMACLRRARRVLRENRRRQSREILAPACN